MPAAKKTPAKTPKTHWKDTLFLATCTIESVYYAATKYHHLDATPEGYRINEENFKQTYQHLKKLYEEL